MVYVSQPLDTVKVKMQAFPKLYTSMINCFVTTFKRDGITRGLYAGDTDLFRLYFYSLNNIFLV
jgi:solute carrier family 25 ornithine transporter 2/15